MPNKNMILIISLAVLPGYSADAIGELSTQKGGDGD